MTNKWFRLIMSDENSEEDSFYWSEVDICGVKPERLLEGKPISEWSTDACLRSNSIKHDGIPDDVLFPFTIPVFSPRLQQSLHDAGVGIAEIQYLPIHIVQSTGRKAEGFAVVNILNCVAALDRENSFLLSEDKEVIDPATGLPKITCVGRPALYEAALESRDITRMAEYRREVLVSENFAKVFAEGRFTGAITSPL